MFSIMKHSWDCCMHHCVFFSDPLDWALLSRRQIMLLFFQPDMLKAWLLPQEFLPRHQENRYGTPHNCYSTTYNSNSQKCHGAALPQATLQIFMQNYKRWQFLFQLTASTLHCSTGSQPGTLLSCIPYSSDVCMFFKHKVDKWNIKMIFWKPAPKDDEGYFIWANEWSQLQIGRVNS